jgi:hypothetical protein
MRLANDALNPSTAAAGQLQIGAQLSRNTPENPAENVSFATSVGPQEAFTVAKIASGPVTEVSDHNQLLWN